MFIKNCKIYPTSQSFHGGVIIPNKNNQMDSVLEQSTTITTSKSSFWAMPSMERLNNDPVKEKAAAIFGKRSCSQDGSNNNQLFDPGIQYERDKNLVNKNITNFEEFNHSETVFDEVPDSLEQDNLENNQTVSENYDNLENMEFHNQHLLLTKTVSEVFEAPQCPAPIPENRKHLKNEKQLRTMEYVNELLILNNEKVQIIAENSKIKKSESFKRGKTPKSSLTKSNSFKSNSFSKSSHTSSLEKTTSSSTGVSSAYKKPKNSKSTKPSSSSQYQSSSKSSKFHSSSFSRSTITQNNKNSVSSSFSSGSQPEVLCLKSYNSSSKATSKDFSSKEFTTKKSTEEDMSEKIKSIKSCKHASFNVLIR